MGALCSAFSPLSTPLAMKYTCDPSWETAATLCTSAPPDTGTDTLTKSGQALTSPDERCSHPPESPGSTHSYRLLVPSVPPANGCSEVKNTFAPSVEAPW